MRSNGLQTRDRILTTAQNLILSRGFSGTSIDRIIDDASVTKSGFFYHFEGKRDLAKNLLVRFLEEDYQISQELLTRAKSLTEDPLQQLLIFLNLNAELADELPSGHPGCLVASYIYEAQQFDDEIHKIARLGIEKWKALIVNMLESATKKYTPVIDTDVNELADMFAAVYEGAIVIGKLTADKKVLSKQILLYRNYIRFIFADLSCKKVSAIE